MKSVFTTFFMFPLLLLSPIPTSSSSISSSVLDYILQKTGRLDSIFRDDLGNAKESSKRRASDQLIDLVQTFVKTGDKIKTKTEVTQPQEEQLEEINQTSRNYIDKVSSFPVHLSAPIKKLVDISKQPISNKVHNIGPNIVMKPFTFFTSAQLTTTNRQNTFQNPPVGALAQPITNSVRKQKPFQLGLPLNNPGRKFEPLFERDNQIDIQHQPFPLPQHTFYSKLPEQT